MLIGTKIDIAIVCKNVHLHRIRNSRNREMPPAILNFFDEIFFSFSNPNSGKTADVIEKVTKRSGDMANAFDILQTERRYLQRLIFDRFLNMSKITKIDRGSNSRPHTGAAVRDTTKSSLRHL